MTKQSVDMATRITDIERRLTGLEKATKKIARKKRDYTDEQRAAIRTRLLAGQEAARKRFVSDIDDIKIIQSSSDKPTETKQAVKAKRLKKQSEPVVS